MLITIFGIAALSAVFAVAFFLLWVTLPLFLPAQADQPAEVQLAAAMDPLHLGIDEYQQLGWWLLPSGLLEVFRLDSGEIRQRSQLFADRELRSASFHPHHPLAVFGLADGTVQTAQIEFAGEIHRPEDLAPETRLQLEAAPDGKAISTGDGLLQQTPSGHLRLLELRAQLASPITVAAGPIRLVRHIMTTQGPWIVALVEEEAEPRLFAIRGEQRTDFLTGQSSLVFQDPVELPYRQLAGEAPAFLEILANGSDIFVAWESGELLRVHLSPTSDAFIAEQGRLVAEGRKLTSMGHLLGQQTLVWGDSSGDVQGGFLVHVAEHRLAVAAGRAEIYGGLSGLQRDPRATHFLALTKQVAHQGAGTVAASALASSARSRLLLTGFSDGEIRLSNVTNEAELASLQLGADVKTVTRLIMAPKEDGFLALADRHLFHTTFDPGYPEASLRGLLTPVWYEGYNEPRHIWQPTGGTDDFEPKLGLYPLLFGTLKATFYSMLIAAPLAILSAIFTSEFLTRQAREVVKPTLELMASIPGVVLGFLAALVFAPFVEGMLPVLLTFLLTLPLSWLAGAQFWQWLPTDIVPRSGRSRLFFIALTLPMSFFLAMGLAPLLEAVLFAGNLKAWLAWNALGGEPGPFANTIGGWLLLLVPLCALLVTLAWSRWPRPLRARRGSWNRGRPDGVQPLRLLAGLAATAAVALTASALLHFAGFDPRGGFVDTYSQRNALIVGFAMGFTVIPVIFTLAEDALSAVPGHLRAASLAAGATPWQTALRIVLPTAASGLISALMVGLGRAAGETMIVLMAAGNTPILEWNLFAGLRAMSASLAVELPEAVQGSTHYRTLFLAALALFTLTFLINTLAEVIRLRFRQRAFQL